MVSKKDKIRQFLFFLIGRYPFVNAVSLLMLLAERAQREKYVGSIRFITRLETDRIQIIKLSFCFFYLVSFSLVQCTIVTKMDSTYLGY